MKGLLRAREYGSEENTEILTTENKGNLVRGWILSDMRGLLLIIYVW